MLPGMAAVSESLEQIVSFSVARILLAVASAALLTTGCSQVVHELKAARNPRGEALHERISEAIQDSGFSHGIRSVREGAREIDTVFVAIPLDSLKRQHISLHQMLFNVARLCARPEFAKTSIQIELNAADERDRNYLRGIVEPLVAEARNVTVIAQRESDNDIVITLSTVSGAAQAKGAGTASR